ncbi:hypothetical protein C8Q74DRAFT_596141 [Fomes fomentarius]|nr:hypothetical protein C8Q74DRAFT_596141 [Fomes fomentarius]
MLLDLNDDVLLSILSHLHGNFALSATLTCRRIYELCISRTVAVLTCDSTEQLARLHEHLCGRPQAKYVEVLKISSSTFPKSYLEDEDLDLRSHLHGNFDQAHYVGDILQNTHSLHDLVLSRLHPLTERDTRILPVILALRLLTSFEFDTVGDSSIRALHGASFVDLQSLYISYHNDPLGMPIPGESTTLPPLLQLLALFPKLHSLTLLFLTPDRSFHEPLYTPPSFPSIKYLHLDYVSSATLDIVQLCPNVSTIYLGLGGDDLSHDILPVDGQRWNTLRSLRLQGEREAKCIDNLIPLTQHLEFVDFVSVDDPSAILPGQVSHARLVETFRKASPVSVSLWILPGISPMSFLPAAAKVAPRLRVLSLQVGVPSSGASFAQLVEQLPGILNELSLAYLQIWLPSNVSGTQEAQLTDEERTHQKEFDAAMLLQGGTLLPRAIADALRTLRYLKLVARREATEGDEIEDRERSARRKERIVTYDEDGDEEPDPDAYEEELPWGRAPGERTTIRTWRIVHDGDARHLQLLTNREAARVQRFMENASFEEIELAHVW